MTRASGGLDDLSQHILAALQVDGRASWARIAAALGEPERTVARRGSELLRTQDVRIRALAHPWRVRRAEQFILRVSCTAGAVGIAGAALAQRPETLQAFITTGAADVVAELSTTAERFSELVVQQVGGTRGVVAYSAYPVLGYFRAMHQWRPPILTDEQFQALGGDRYATDPDADVEVDELDKEDVNLLRQLSVDGRASFEELSRATGMSIQTVSRRVERMRSGGTLSIRAVFEPALIGLAVEVLLWLRLPFPEIDRLGAAVIESPAVRYASALAGDYQMLVDAVFPSRGGLFAFLKSSGWVREVSSIEPTLVVEPLKRSRTMTARSAAVDDL